MARRSTPNVLSPARRSELLERVRAGETMGRVARDLGVDERTVRHHCRRAGVASSYSQRRVPEDDIVESWWRVRDRGSTVSAEARRLGMNPSVLTTRLAPYRRHHVASGGEDPVRRVRRE